MSAHVTSVHEMKCQFCPSHFLTKKDLDQHINTCNDMPILSIPLFDKKGFGSVHKIKCHFCFEKFAIGEDMSAHDIFNNLASEDPLNVNNGQY